LQWRIGTLFIVVLISAWFPTPADSAKRKHRSNAPIIRNILINPKNVFDPGIPGENKWPYTWANFVHITTHAGVIRHELLVKPGQPADPEAVAESERLLRSLSFIREARIRTVPVGDGRVDLIVETHDSWTTEPQVNFGMEGEKNHKSAGFLEENFLGYGKTVSYFYRDNPEGVSHEYGYADPQLLHTRFRLNSQYVDTPSGDQEKLNLTRPFYSLTTRTAGGASWGHELGTSDIITNGVKTSEYRREHHDADIFLGARVNNNPDNVHRLSLRYAYQTDYFTPTQLTIPGTLPANRTIGGPGPVWDWVQNDFIKETFVDRVERVEDINLGNQMQVSGVYAARALGSTDDSVPFAGAHQFGFGNEGDSFALASYGTTGRYTINAANHQGESKLSNTLYFVNANYYKHLPTEFPFTAVVHGESGYVQNMNLDNQLELGGDTGLRGFKSTAFTGNKTILMNLEGRAYYPHEILHLAYLGGACFVDAGQAQPEGSPFTEKDMHASVGFGLRIALTRSTSGSVYRFDVAYAIGPINQDKRIVFSISSGQGFNRNANTFGKFPGLPLLQDAGGQGE
jgi:outer membrane protein assembly factor BamA